MGDYLFVYGTLRPELAPAEARDLIENFRPVGPATVPGRLYDLGRYPGAILDEAAETVVQGEVVELPDDLDVLAALDAYEESYPADLAGSPFVRRRCTARMRDGSKWTAWVYVYHRDPRMALLIPDGDYAAWKSRSARLDP